MCLLSSIVVILGCRLYLSSLVALYLSQPLDLQPLSSFEKCRQIILGNVHLSSVHKLENWLKVGEWNVLQDDDWVLWWVVLQKRFEVRTASWQNHFVRLTGLAITSKCYIRETPLCPEVFEACHNIWLEIIPSETKLLLVRHSSSSIRIGGRQFVKNRQLSKHSLSASNYAADMIRKNV